MSTEQITYRPEEAPTAGSAASGAGVGPTPEAPAEVADGAASSPRLRSFLEVASMVLAPASLLSALLFYFGWTFTNARALYFGVDPSTFGYTTQDYLLRSVDPIFIPLGALLVVAVVILYVHSFLVRWIAEGRHPGRLRVGVAGLAAAGSATFAIGLLGVARGSVFGVNFLLTPLSLCFGIGAVAYAVHLGRRLGSRRRPERLAGAEPRWVAAASSVLVLLLLVLSLFWAVRDWADSVGRGRAQELARSVPYRPGVVVYSKSQLHLDAPGVETTEVGDADAAYRFRYSGLSMLVYSGRKYFLVATQSPPEAPTTIVLPDRDDLRLEFTSRS